MAKINKSVPRSDQKDLEELKKNYSAIENSAFQQISKICSSGANNTQNQQESEMQQVNSFSKIKSILSQRLIEIQNLNTDIKNNNSTPVAKVRLQSCSELSNQKGLSTAKTNTSLTKSDIKSINQQTIYKSPSSNEIKGYSLLSGLKNDNKTPTAEIIQTNITSSYKKDYETVFSSIFPQKTQKVFFPQEKKLIVQNNLPNNSNSIVRQSSLIQEYKDESPKNQIRSSLIRKYEMNQDPKCLSMQTRNQILNIGGDLSPINKTISNQDNFVQTAQEIIQENCIEWLNSNNEDDFINRGQHLQFERKKIDDQFEVDKKLNESLSIDKQSIDLENQNDQYQKQLGLKKKDDNYNESTNDEVGFKFDVNKQKENLNFKDFEKQNNESTAQKQERNIQIQKNLQLQTINGKSYSKKQQHEDQKNSLNENKKEKILMKRGSKNLKKIRQQNQQILESQQQQINLKQLESDLKNIQNIQNQKRIEQEQSTHQDFDSSYNEQKNKNQQKQLLQNEGGKQQQRANFLNLLKSFQQKSSNYNNHLQNYSVNQQQNSSQLKKNNIFQNITDQNSNENLEENNSPSLSTFSISEEYFQTKKKIKMNNISALEDQSNSSIYNFPTIDTTTNQTKESLNKYNTSVKNSLKKLNENKGNSCIKQDMNIIQQERNLSIRQEKSQETQNQNYQDIKQNCIQSQSQVIARQNSLVRPKIQQNEQLEQNYIHSKTNIETKSPQTQAIIYDNTNQFELIYKQQKPSFLSMNAAGLQQSSQNQYSNPNQQYSLNKQSLQKSKYTNNSNFQRFGDQRYKLQTKISNPISCKKEQIQEQIEFNNQLKDQFERKIKEEQLYGLKYSQCSSTKRLKFQLLNQDEQQKDTYAYGQNNSFYPCHLLSNKIINQKSLYDDNMVSPILENERNSGYDDVSPILYSPGVQFSPVDSDQEINNN